MSEDKKEFRRHTSHTDANNHHRLFRHGNIVAGVFVETVYIRLFNVGDVIRTLRSESIRRSVHVFLLISARSSCK